MNNESTQRQEALEKQNALFKTIHSKARWNYNREVEVLLERGCNPDLRDEHGNTPLHIAAQNGHEEVVKTLLKYKAYVNCVNLSGNTALHFAYTYKYVDIGEL